MRAHVALALSVLVVVACSGGTATTAIPGSPSPAPTAGPSSAPTAGPPSAPPSESSDPTVYVGGDRAVAVIEPPGYDPARPAPLLIVLHGYGSSGFEHDAYFHVGELAAQRGYLYIHPDGTRDDDGNRFWNATDACCDFDGRGVDDVAYLAGVIDEIGASFAVDPKRIYLLGHSNGGFMSYALACAHADKVAAIASLAGATFAEPVDCAPTEPVAVAEIHGTADDTILFEGGTIDLGSVQSTADYPGAEASVSTWATYDGCASPSVIDDRIDIDAGVSVDGDPAETTVTRWTGCQPGGAAELWTIRNGGHGPDISDAFPAAVLDFFEAHPKP